MNEDYTADAELYDVVYAEYDADINFYVEEAQRANGPVLELACGTGRVLIPVAAAGVQVSGLELSPQMLSRARRKFAALPGDLQGRIELRQGDMRTFDLGRQFALIYIPFRAFLHLLQMGDQLTALATIRRHLLPTGRLVLNFFDPSVEYIAAQMRDPQGSLNRTGEEFADPRTGNTMIEWATVSYDQLNQRLDQYFIYDHIDARGRVVQRVYRQLKLRYIFRWEFEHMLQRAGYEVEALYGSFDRGPVLYPGGELIWIARARE